MLNSNLLYKLFTPDYHYLNLFHLQKLGEVVLFGTPLFSVTIAHSIQLHIPIHFLLLIVTCIVSGHNSVPYVITDPTHTNYILSLCVFNTSGLSAEARLQREQSRRRSLGQKCPHVDATWRMYIAHIPMRWQIIWRRSHRYPLFFMW